MTKYRYVTNLQIRHLLYLADRQPGAVRFRGPPPQRESHKDDHSCYRQSSCLATSLLCKAEIKIKNPSTARDFPHETYSDASLHTGFSH